MKRSVGISVVFLLASCALVGLLWCVPKFQARSLRERLNQEDVRQLEARDRVQLEKEIIQAENNARLTLAQVLGGVVLLTGLFLTWRNLKITQETATNNLMISERTLRITEEGKITERFSKAIEHLGHDKLEVRLGSIYALERIAQDSEKDHWPIMEVLTSFVRERAASTGDSNDENLREKNLGTVPADVQAILSVIARRRRFFRHGEGQPLNLHATSLQGVDLSNAHLEGADLTGAHLEGAVLFYARLEDAILSAAHLRESVLDEANLEGALLIGADLRGATLKHSNLRRANLEDAQIEGNQLQDAEIDGAHLPQSLKGWRKSGKEVLD